MSFEQELSREQLKDEYFSVKGSAAPALKRVQEWKADLDTLRAKITDPVELTEITQLETDMITALRAVFGI